MRSKIQMVVAALVGCWIGTAAFANPTGGTPAVATDPIPPNPETQKIILDQVKRSPGLPQSDLSEPARIGMTIPPEVELLKLPQDMTTEVATVTSYNYIIAKDVIAVVDPESRKIIQLIKR
jgi:hypothetical protein